MHNKDGNDHRRSSVSLGDLFGRQEQPAEVQNGECSLKSSSGKAVSEPGWPYGAVGTVVVSPSNNQPERVEGGRFLGGARGTSC